MFCYTAKGCNKGTLLKKPRIKVNDGGQKNDDLKKIHYSPCQFYSTSKNYIWALVNILLLILSIISIDFIPL